MTIRTHESIFQEYRPLLNGLAYRMLGSLADAEDIVQETYLRWRATDLESVRDPRPWLVKACSRLAINTLKSARTRREQYVGTWLPEPWVDLESGPLDRVQIDETVSMALLLAMEKLSAAERAAFILHDIFEHSFDEIASILGRSSIGCRKLASRARERLRRQGPRFQADPAEHLELVNAFLMAARGGEFDRLKGLLSEEVKLFTDGGGRVPAPRQILIGAGQVARFMIGVWRNLARQRATVTVIARRFNGVPGLLIFEGARLATALSIRVERGRICVVYAIRNPEKLSIFLKR